MGRGTIVRLSRSRVGHEELICSVAVTCIAAALRVIVVGSVVAAVEARPPPYATLVLLLTLLMLLTGYGVLHRRHMTVPSLSIAERHSANRGAVSPDESPGIVAQQLGAIWRATGQRASNGAPVMRALATAIVGGPQHLECCMPVPVANVGGSFSSRSPEVFQVGRCWSCARGICPKQADA